MLKWLSKYWALDLRALAALRIAYGILIIQDLLIRASDLQAHYTDWGVAPRQSVLELSWFPSYVSLHMMNGTWPFQALLFVFAMVVAASLALGYRTRLSAVVSYILLVSLHNRNAVVLDGGDNYLRVVLFWAMFMPLGARWSLDSYLAPDPDESESRSNSWFDMAGFAYMAQLGLIYGFSGLLKTAPEWRVDGTAVYYALMIDQLATPRAAWLLAYPQLLKPLTFSTLAFECAVPFMIYLPGPIRLVAALGISLMHLGFGTFMHLGVFAMIGMASPVGLWPGFVFDRLEKTSAFGWASSQAQRLCATLVRWGGGSAKLVYEPCWRGSHGEMTRASLGVLLVMVILWNYTSIPGKKLPFPFPDDLMRAVRLDQSWNMFAPKPLVEDGWYVIEATLVDGRKVDLFQGGSPVNWDKPAHVASTYPNARWRKFMMNIWAADLSKWRLPYGRYLTREWNSQHQGSDQVATFKIYFMLETTLLDGQTKPPERIVIWTHNCFDNPNLSVPAGGAKVSPTPTSTPSPSGAAQS